MTATPHHKPETHDSVNLERAIERLREATDTAGKDAFAARAVNALTRLVDEGDEKTLVAATGARSDYDVLLQVLEQPEAIGDMDAGSLALARMRGLRYRRRMLSANGGTLTSQEVADILQISRQAVDKRRRAGRLIGLEIGRRGYAYPTWQFDPQHGTLPGLEAVLEDLADHDPWMQLSFMLNANAYLDDETPLDVLRAGELRRVRRAAQSFGEQGAA